MAAWGERRGVPRSNGNEARRTSKFEQLFSDHLLSNRATTRGKNDVGPSDGTKHARTMSLHAFRAVACVASLRPFSRVSSSFVPCGEGFAPEGFQGDGSRTSKKTSTGADKECAKTVVLADVGHGIGRALLAALLEYPDCRLTVAAATPSADLVQSLRNQHKSIWATTPTSRAGGTKLPSRTAHQTSSSPTWGACPRSGSLITGNR